MTTPTLPLLLDTDIGSDIDDAVCLSYLLRQPRCELLGITTMTGEDPRVRASLADAVCRAAGRDDIPIHSGAATSLYTGQVVQPPVPQAAVLPRFEHRPPDDFAPNSAVDFLRRTIHERPGQVTLLAIGPMTNVALLFALDPTIPAKLKQLVLMCGVFFRRLPNLPLREWNAVSDPLATHLTYRTPAPGHLSIGLDVTRQVQMPTQQCIERFRAIGGPLAVVAAMTEVWSSQRSSVTFHDPLAAAVVFRPEICRYQQGAVSVEIANPALAGLTLFDAKAAAAPHRVAAEVDADAFFREYFTVTQG